MRNFSYFLRKLLRTTDFLRKQCQIFLTYSFRYFFLFENFLWQWRVLFQFASRTGEENRTWANQMWLSASCGDQNKHSSLHISLIFLKSSCVNQNLIRSNIEPLETWTIVTFFQDPFRNHVVQFLLFFVVFWPDPP